MTSMRFQTLGWMRDMPDFRDYTDDHGSVKDVLDKSVPLRNARTALPASVDLREWCSPVEDQENLGSCTANAGVALMEYFQRQAFGEHLDGSRIFLYKVTRNLLGWTDDDGAYLRTTMKAMALFGICPEEFWPYTVSEFNKEPPAFCYALAQSFQATTYYRLDPPGKNPQDILLSVKQKLAAKLPSMFGFVVYTSMPVDKGHPDIPFPGKHDKQRGGHAVVAVGYDDKRTIGKYSGALLIRNSWGTEWGDKGYGWLPYEYVLKGLAVDFWSLSNAEFVSTQLFA